MELLGHGAFSRFEVHEDEDEQYHNASVNGDHAGRAVASVMEDEFCGITKPSSEGRFYDILFEMSVPAFDIESSVQHLVLLNKLFKLFNSLSFTVFVFEKGIENFKVNFENTI